MLLDPDRDYAADELDRAVEPVDPADPWARDDDGRSRDDTEGSEGNGDDRTATDDTERERGSGSLSDFS